MSDDCTAVETALVGALQKRYSPDSVWESDRVLNDILFMKSMKDVYQKFGADHPIVCALYADSLLLMKPYKIMG